MREYIKRYLFVRGVCKKYQIKYKQVWDVSKSYLGEDSKTIACNLFSQDFWPVFLHELGHLLDFKVRDYGHYVVSLEHTFGRTCTTIASEIPECYWYTTRESSITTVLTQEANASRTAKKLLKKFNLTDKNNYLEDAINTYLKGLYPRFNCGIVSNVAHTVKKRIGLY